LLIPLENLIDTDPRVYRTSGLDGLPAVGIKRGVEIVVPYRIYLPRKFYRFAKLNANLPTNWIIDNLMNSNYGKLWGSSCMYSKRFI
jgi:hypothetical protein